MKANKIMDIMSYLQIKTKISRVDHSIQSLNINMQIKM